MIGGGSHEFVETLACFEKVIENDSCILMKWSWTCFVHEHLTKVANNFKPTLPAHVWLVTNQWSRVNKTRVLFGCLRKNLQKDVLLPMHTTESLATAQAIANWIAYTSPQNHPNPCLPHKHPAVRQPLGIWLFSLHKNPQSHNAHAKASSESDLNQAGVCGSDHSQKVFLWFLNTRGSYYWDEVGLVCSSVAGWFAWLDGQLVGLI